MVEPEAPPRTEPSSIRPGTEEARSRPEEPIARTAEAAPPRPEPSSDDFPGTEPIREEVPPREGEVPPAPEEVPPERAGEIPMAEEAPPPRAEETSPRSADAEGGTNLPADDDDVTAEEVPPMTIVPGVPQSTVPLPDEDLIAETRGVPPDAPAEGEDVATPAEAPREDPPPGEERPERRGL
jgi:hypothetical protein